MRHMSRIGGFASGLIALAVLSLVAGSAAAGAPPALAPGQVRLSVIYDNTVADAAYKCDWGFACLIETPEKRVLFDAGRDEPVWVANFAALGREAKSIDAFVLSHDHGDHTGGLAAFLRAAAAPALFLPPGFSGPERVRSLTKGKIVEAAGPIEVVPGIWTTGSTKVRDEFYEQALVVRTEKGLVVVTGCAHPGVANQVRQAKEVARDKGLTPADVDLVIGGFHMLQDAPAVIQAAIDELKRLGVRRIAPSHCTGEQATKMIAKAWGGDLVRAGAGWSQTLGSDQGGGPGKPGSPSR